MIADYKDNWHDRASSAVDEQYDASIKIYGIAGRLASVFGDDNHMVVELCRVAKSLSDSGEKLNDALNEAVSKLVRNQDEASYNIMRAAVVGAGGPVLPEMGDKS